MRPAAGATDFAGEVAPTVKVAAIAARVEAASLPFAVVEGGRVVGLVDRAAVLGVLLGAEAPA
jgi:glycine betaine/proline transport system ATP-binding protein